MKSPIFKRPLRVFYSEDYAVGEGLETVTKSKLLAKMITEGRVPRVELVAPKIATEEELLLIHSPEYVERVLNGETQVGDGRGQVGKVTRNVAEGHEGTRGQGGTLARGAPLPVNKLVRSVLATTGGMRVWDSVLLTDWLWPRWRR